MYYILYGIKAWQGKTLTVEHTPNFDEQNFDELIIGFIEGTLRWNG